MFRFLSRIFRLACLKWNQLWVSGTHGLLFIGSQMVLAWTFALLCAGQVPNPAQLVEFWRYALLVMGIYLFFSSHLSKNHRSLVAISRFERLGVLFFLLLGLFCLQVLLIAVLLSPLFYYQHLDLNTLLKSLFSLLDAHQILPSLQMLAMEALDQISVIENQQHFLNPLERWYIEFIFPIALPSICMCFLFLMRSARKRRSDNTLSSKK